MCPAPVQQRWRSAAAVGAPPVPLPPGKLARRGAEGVGNIKLVTATEQSIVRIASRSSKSQPQQQSFQQGLHPSSCQGGVIEIAAQVPLSPHPPGQPARDGEVGGSRRVGARSETKCIQIQTSTYIPAAVQQRWLSAAAEGAPSVPLPQGKLARRRAEGVPVFFCVCVCGSGTVGNRTPETATEQSIVGIARRTRQSEQQQQSFKPGLLSPGRSSGRLLKTMKSRLPVS